MQGHITVKELPDSEKPYEKCLKNGAKSLSDAELLAVIIKTGTKDFKSIEIAEILLSVNHMGLMNLYQMNMEELKELPGIGTVKAIQLKCLTEISRRLASQTRFQAMILSNPKSVASYYMEELRHESRERLIVSMFDAKCMYLGEDTISIGTVNASLVSPREVFIEALEKKAVQIILLHNHPSGAVEPSVEDQRVTARVKECGDMLGIRLVDHIIIGDNQYFSFKEEGLFPKGQRSNE